MRIQSSIFLVIISILGLLHAAVFFLFWLTNSLFYADVNNFLFSKLGRRLDYIRLTQILSLVVLLGGMALLFLIFQKGHHPGWVAWLYGIGAILYLIFFYGSFWVLISQSPVQWVRLWRLVGYFRLVIDLILLASWVFVLRAVGLKFSVWDANKIVTGVFCLLIYIALWCLAYLSPPGSVYQNPLPPKPRLIAHRGASMLVPENTLAAARRAWVLGADGLEIDIRISLDGVPFLMHDSSLLRTTDVASIFPERANDRPENFTLVELKQLNASAWFFMTDPYRTIAKGLLNPAEIQAMGWERIPTLAAVLEFLKENQLVFIFDLLRPPPEHPFYDQFFDICLSQIHQAGFDSRIWFLAKGAEKEAVTSLAPDMILAYGADYKNPPEADELAGEGYRVINVEYGIPLEQVPHYHAGGLNVNLYVVDEPWMFSQSWLEGVDSLTTNNVHSLAALGQPVFGLTRVLYLWIWGLAGLVGFGIAFSAWIP